ncbi:MAG: hypothetical protein ACRD6W_16605, partial [Nitrososphaerales archaeon]
SVAGLPHPALVVAASAIALVVALAWIIRAATVILAAAGLGLLVLGDGSATALVVCALGGCSPGWSGSYAGGDAEALGGDVANGSTPASVGRLPPRSPRSRPRPRSQTIRLGPSIEERSAGNADAAPALHVDGDTSCGGAGSALLTPIRQGLGASRLLPAGRRFPAVTSSRPPAVFAPDMAPPSPLRLRC